MISVVFGTVAALCWGVQNVMLAGSARRGDPRTAALAYVGYMALLALPFAIATFDPGSLRTTNVGFILLGGTGQGVGMLLFTRALDLGPVGLLTGLLSLEGAGAAILSMLAGEALGVPVLVGLVAASAGGIMLVSATGDNLPRKAVYLTLVAVAGNALGLWALGLYEVPLPLSLVLYNGASAVTMAIVLKAERRSLTASLFKSVRGELFFVSTSALGVIGLAAFAYGAREGSIAITAVLGAQFASVAAIVSYFVFRERMEPRQLLGFLALITGISLIAGFA